MHLLLSGVKCYAGKTSPLHQVLSLAINSLGQLRSFRGKTQIFRVLFSELANPLHHPENEFLSKAGKTQTQWDPAELWCPLLPPAHAKPYHGVPVTLLPALPGQDSVPRLAASRGVSAETLDSCRRKIIAAKRSQPAVLVVRVLFFPLMAINLSVTFFSVPQGKCSFMRKVKSGVSELILPLKEAGAHWCSQEAFGPVAELILLFSDTTYAPNPGWLLAEHTLVPPGEWGSLLQSRDQRCAAALPLSPGLLQASWPHWPGLSSPRGGF